MGCEERSLSLKGLMEKILIKETLQESLERAIIMSKILLGEDTP